MAGKKGGAHRVKNFGRRARGVGASERAAGGGQWRMSAKREVDRGGERTEKVVGRWIEKRHEKRRARHDLRRRESNWDRKSLLLA